MFWAKNISCITYFKCPPNQLGLFSQSKRWKQTREHWASLRKKKNASNKALEHFDDFYASVYGAQWRSIRVALLSPHKYCAVVNNFGDVDETSSFLESEGAHNMKNVLNVQKSQLKSKNVKIDKMKEKDSEHLSNEVNSSAGDIKDERLEKTCSKDVDNSVSKDKSKGDDSADDLDWSRQITPNSSTSSASLYDFVPTNQIKGKDEWISESDHYSYYENYSQVPIEIVSEDNLHFPDHLKVYCFESSNISFFKEPRKCSTGVLSYYLMNASSLLPVLALNIAPGDRVLDMCAAPGGKTILALQTLYPELVVSNDHHRSRRLYEVLNDYFYDIEKHVKVTSVDARHIDEADVYDKILVDVPCTNDRHAVQDNDYNIFVGKRIKERLRLPELQAQLLNNALKLVKVGGTVVYSTCSLSPIQNDGVVQMGLRRIWEETNHRFVVSNMGNALASAKIFYRFGDAFRLKYGHIVLPYLPANFGPLYFCKLVRVE